MTGSSSCLCGSETACPLTTEHNQDVQRCSRVAGMCAHSRLAALPAQLYAASAYAPCITCSEHATPSPLIPA